jgi:ribosome-associated translation inhibitor RaiA
MAFETTVVFRDMDASPALRDDVLRHAAKLERFAPGILSCHVTVVHAEHHHHQGNRFLVHARLTLPGAEIEAGQTHSPNRAHEDPHRAVVDTFDALRRELQDFVRKRRGDVKVHARGAGNA